MEIIMKKLLSLAILFMLLFTACSEDAETLVNTTEDTELADTECDSCELAELVEHAAIHMNGTEFVAIVADSMGSDTIDAQHTKYVVEIQNKVDSTYTGNIVVTVDEAGDYIFFGDKAIKILQLDATGEIVAYEDHQHVDQDGIEVTFVYELEAGSHMFQLGPGPSVDSTYSIVFEHMEHDHEHDEDEEDHDDEEEDHDEDEH